jgi:hypothetical protein
MRFEGRILSEAFDLQTNRVRSLKRLALHLERAAAEKA